MAALLLKIPLALCIAFALLKFFDFFLCLSKTLYLQIGV